MQFVIDWMEENRKKGKEPYNPNQLAIELKIQRAKLDRMLGKTKDTREKPQEAFNRNVIKRLRLLMGWSIDKFYKAYEEA